MPTPSLADWSYEPHESIPGAVTFYDPTDKPLTLTGGAAAEMRDRVERFKAAREAASVVGSQPVAGPGGGDAGTYLANWQPKAVPAAPAPDIIGPSGPGGASVPGATVPASTPVAPASAQRAPAPVATGGAPAGFQNVGFGIYRTPDGQLVKRTAGSPAVTKEMLEKRAAEAVATPQGMSTTRTGGFTPSEEYLQGMNANFQRQAALAEEIRDNAIRKDAAELEGIKAREAMVTQHMEEQRQMAAEIEDRVKQDQAAADRARKEYDSSKVDPNRIFSGDGGSLKALVFGVSAALGAFGATLGRTENYAQNTINGIINNDIRAQEAEIAIKRDGANNALAQLQRSGLSRDQSKILLRQIQTDYAMSQAERLRAEAKIPENNTQYQQLKLQLEQNQLQFNEDYRRASLGTRTEQVQSGFAFPRAGTAGGWTPVKDQVGTAKELQSIRQGEATIGKTEADTEKALRAGTSPHANMDMAEKKYDQQLSTLRLSMEQLIRDHGGKFDPQTGKIEGLSFPSDIPGGDTAEMKNLKARLTKLGTQYANMINAGAEAGQPTKEALTPAPDLFGQGGEQQLQAMLTETMIAQRDWNRIKSENIATRPSPPANAAAPTGPTQQIDLQKE